MTCKRKQLPKYCLHKGSGQAYVRIAGDMHYLGKHGSDASRREYDRIMGEFIANGRQAFRHPDEISIADLIVRYLDHIEKNMDYSHGRRNNILRVTQKLNDLYGNMPVSQFGPAALKTLRQGWLDNNLKRGTINTYIGMIQQCFDWGREEEVIPADIAVAVCAVKPLKQGRTTAAEYNIVEPVADEVVEKTLPYIRPPIRDMVMVQRRISGRPQDVFNMRACDIDTSTDVWVYTPFTHKTKKRGKARILYIGPKVQKVLRPYLEQCKDDLEQFLFRRRDGKQYNNNSYNDAIATACKKAGVPHWSPNSGTPGERRCGVNSDWSTRKPHSVMPTPKPRKSMPKSMKKRR